ncbi:restriction endonuclease subunit S [Pseudooceanicola marinus]|uniref:restriction endonuclease subunit S n=1 Tax=Pseudooceanicola marinus TaxID=396013 RepID=UPI001CD1EFBF|nr:restriction endonuclease subunit S [Pseudooceanicola marinus]MCA1334944.1 restriction endonuclease subunit S [Pseudooceanicola marinus]
MSWQSVPLGEVFEIARGGSPRPIDKFITDDPDGLNWVKIGDATASGKYILSTKEKIRKEGLSKTRAVEPGDFLLTNSMSFGRPYIMGTHGCIHDGWLVLKPRRDDTVSQDYMYHVLGSDEIKARFASRAPGSTVKNLNSAMVAETSIPLPPLEEQRRIAGILDAADALRRRRREALALLDTLPGAIFAEMFLSSRPGDPERPTQPLGDLVNAVSGSTPSKSNKAFWNGDIPWISPKDMKTDDLDRAILNITQEATKTGKAKLVGPDVTLIVIRGMILAHSVPVCDLRVPASFNQDVKALVPRKGISNIFISAALRASKNRLLSMVSNAAHGTKRIEMGDLMKFPIPFATEAEQEIFVDAIAAVAAQRARFEGASHDGETLFASLQSRAFAGEL